DAEGRKGRGLWPPAKTIRRTAREPSQLGHFRQDPLDPRRATRAASNEESKMTEQLVASITPFPGTVPGPHQPPRLLDRVRIAIRTRHYSLRTEEAYVGWIRRYIFFHNKRHPQEMGEPEINSFLSGLAVKDRVRASTQNHALSALLFLYRHVLEKPFPPLENVVRAKRPIRLP